MQRGGESPTVELLAPLGKAPSLHRASLLSGHPVRASSGPGPPHFFLMTPLCPNIQYLPAHPTLGLKRLPWELGIALSYLNTTFEMQSPSSEPSVPGAPAQQLGLPRALSTRQVVQSMTKKPLATAHPNDTPGCLGSEHPLPLSPSLGRDPQTIPRPPSSAVLSLG